MSAFNEAASTVRELGWRLKEFFNKKVGTDNLTDGSVTTEILADNSVATEKIIDLNVTTGKMANDSVDNTKLANMAANTFKGRVTAGTGDPEDLTVANALAILGLTGITGAWQSFAPSWTNLTVGTGTNTGAYLQIGKLVFFRTYFKYAAGSSVGAALLNLPVAAAAYAANTTIGLARYTDDNTSTNLNGEIVSSGGLRIFNSAGTYLTPTALSSTVPFTWANNDVITIQGFYEAA